MNIERRYARAGVEFRAATTAGSPGVIAGYAAKYNTLSQNLGGFVESIAPGAFDKSIADGLDVLARYNHDDEALLGRTISGTCRLMLDETGLMYEIDLPNTTTGRDLAELVARSDVYQSSFAFYTIEDEWSMTEQGFPLRTLKAVRLVDVAPVNTPAYLDTSSGLRSLAEARGLELSAVMAAAESNNLGDLLTSAPDTRSEDAEPEQTQSVIDFRMKQMLLREKQK